jgi:hypothetical protein
MLRLTPCFLNCTIPWAFPQEKSGTFNVLEDYVYRKML